MSRQLSSVSKHSADGIGTASQADAGQRLKSTKARAEGGRISRTKNMCLDLRSEVKQVEENEGPLEFSEINIALFEDELKRNNCQRVEQGALSNKLPVIHTPKVSKAFAGEDQNQDDQHYLSSISQPKKSLRSNAGSDL